MKAKTRYYRTRIGMIAATEFKEEGKIVKTDKMLVTIPAHHKGDELKKKELK